MNSTPNVRRLIITVLWLAGFNSPHAQDQENWDVTLPRGIPVRSLLQRKKDLDVGGHFTR